MRHVTTVCSLLAMGGLVAACGDDGGDTPRPDAMATPDAGADAAPSTVAPVTGVTPSAAGTCEPVGVSWTAPAGSTGVIVARQRGGAVAGAPVDGDTYAAGDALPGGGEVAYVGSAATFDDGEVFAHGDVVHYAIYNVASGDRYSMPARTSLTVDRSLGVQAGQLSIALDGTVTPTNPARFTTASTAAYDAGADTLTVTVALTNAACRAVQNPKLVVGTISDGDATAAGNATLEGTPVLAWGPGPILDEGTSPTLDLVLSNVDGATDPVVVDFTIVDHPTLVLRGQYDFAARLVDASGALGAGAFVPMSDLAFSAGNDSTAHPGVISPDGELAYLGHGQQPQLLTLDLAGQTVVGGADLTGADGITTDGLGTIGYVADVAQSPDHRYLYATLVTGDHRVYNNNLGDVGGRFEDGVSTVGVELIKLARTTLAEVERVTLVAPGTTRVRASSLSLSADGRMAALAIRRTGQLLRIDLETMTVVDTVDTSARSTEPHRVALAPDGGRVYISYRGDGRGGPAHDDALDAYDFAAGTFTALAMTTPSAGLTDNKTAFLTFGPDGRLYFGRKRGAVGMSVFDVGTGAETELLAGHAADGIVFGTDGYWVVVDYSVALSFDQSTDAARAFPGTGLNNLNVSDGFGHMALATPL
ncbi:MAG: hypothetical protein R2939_08940 [Kofleriaceae bacterium]